MIVLKKIQPMFTQIITTAERYGEVKTKSGLIDSTKSDTLKEYQRVLAVGPNASLVKVGDLVCVNPTNYAVKKFDKNSTKEAMVENYNQVITYNFNFIEIDGQLCLRLRDNDIDFIVEEYEEVEDDETIEALNKLQNPEKTPKILVPESKIILP